MKADTTVASAEVDHHTFDRVGGRTGTAGTEEGGTAASRRSSAAVSLKLRLMSADLMALCVGSLLAFLVQRVARPVPRFIWTDHLALFVMSLPGFAFGAAVARLYQSRSNERPIDEWANVVKAVLIGVGALVAAGFLWQYHELSRLWVTALAICAVSTVIVEREIARRVFRRMRRDGKLRRRILIVGTDANAVGLWHSLQRRPDLGYEAMGFIGDDAFAARAEMEVLGGYDDVTDVLDRVGANGIVVSLGSVAPETVNQMSRRLTDLGYHVAISTSLHDIDVTRIRPQQLDGRTLLYVEPVIRTGWRAVAKRGFDITAALGGLLVASPVLAVSALLIKLDSKGPVFFRQIRVGRDGELFEILKLRTMTTDAEERKADLAALNEADGPLFKMTNDPRITRVGRYLRKLSIDELPQLVCVLRGTMSLVGPRPALPSEVAQWDDETRERLRVLPGLTGMWQVSGRSNSTFEEYKRLDLYYVDNWSLAHDLRICFRTVGVVMSGSGAS